MGIWPQSARLAIIIGPSGTPLRPSMRLAMILVIDNEDSFVHNLARYFACQGQETTTVRQDKLTLDTVRAMAPSAIVLSPGPGSPNEQTFAVQVVREFWQQLPILGVCLGHQQIGVAFGAKMIRASQPVHGRTSPIHHDGLAEFRGIETPFTATRYHSLLIDESTLPASLRVTARTDDGTMMGLRVEAHSVVGWQFHPESILTEVGAELISGFLSTAGLSTDSRQAQAPASRKDEGLVNSPAQTLDSSGMPL